jgi:hemerythrin superfamily protein
MTTPEQQIDGLALLEDDHRTVESLYERFRSAPRTDLATRRELVNAIVRELSIHAAIEEQFLYPATREAFPSGRDLAEHSVDEHQRIKKLLTAVDKSRPDDDQLDGRLDALMAEVTEHVGEEEGELFPRLRTALGRDRIRRLGEDLQTAKAAAPTRPHPGAPNRPPWNFVTGPMAAALDRAFDVFRRFPA